MLCPSPPNRGYETQNRKKLKFGASKLYIYYIVLRPVTFLLPYILLLLQARRCYDLVQHTRVNTSTRTGLIEMAPAVFPMWGESCRTPTVAQPSSRQLQQSATVSVFSRRRDRQSTELQANYVINSVENCTAAIDRKASL